MEITCRGTWEILHFRREKKACIRKCCWRSKDTKDFPCVANF